MKKPIPHERLEFAKRLAIAIKAAGFKDNSKFAFAVEVKPQSVHQWLKGETQPKQGNMKLVLEKLRVTRDWLFDGLGDGPGLQDADISSSGENDTGGIPDTEFTLELFDNNQTAEVRLVELEDISVSKGVLQFKKTTQVRVPISPMFPTGPKSVSFIMRDRSMEPEVLKGELVVIDPEADPIPGDLIAVRLVNKSLNLFRRFTYGINGAVTLAPANFGYETLQFTAEEWKANVVVLGVKTIAMSGRRT